jgi:hypothetical protein
MRLSLLRNRFLLSACSVLMTAGLASSALAQVNVITVDCTPFQSPNPITSFGPDNTIGMSLQAVDMGGDFIVTEVTPAAFRAMTATQLSAYDLIAINNNPSRIDCGSGLGLGTTWHSVIGVRFGGRIVLCSHDAARFKIIIPPGQAFFGTGAPGPGVEPFGADELVRQAALWAGGGTRTGLLIFNDSARWLPSVGGVGWDNPELNLPAVWGIKDLDQTGGNLCDGGYTFILPAFKPHPIYFGLSDARFGVNSISTFAANIGDTSFHSVFGAYNPTIFTPTEVIVNSGVVDVGGYNAMFGIGANAATPGPDGTSVITLVRCERDQCKCPGLPVPLDILPGLCPNFVDIRSGDLLTVAVAGMEDFNATSVDPTSVRLEGVPPIRWAVGDVTTPYLPMLGKQGARDCIRSGPDGNPDLVLYFPPRFANAGRPIGGSDDMLVFELRGRILNGPPIRGEDVVLMR